MFSFASYAKQEVSSSAPVVGFGLCIPLPFFVMQLDIIILCDSLFRKTGFEMKFVGRYLSKNNWSKKKTCPPVSAEMNSSSVSTGLS